MPNQPTKPEQQKGGERSQQQQQQQRNQDTERNPQGQGQGSSRPDREREDFSKEDPNQRNKDRQGDQDRRGQR